MRKDISQNLVSVSTRFETEKNYWLNQLSGELVKSHFPYDYVKPGEPLSPNTAARTAINIPGELSLKLDHLSNSSDYNLYMILLAGLTLLLERYTGNRDILVAAPIYKQPLEGEYVNTALIMRNRLTGRMTVRELLVQVKKSVVEANKHSNYPIEKLLYLLDMTNYEKNTDLFETMILLRNIHDPGYIKDFNYHVLFSFAKSGGKIEGELEFNPLLYRKDTIERIAAHFVNVLGVVLEDLNLPVERLEILSEDERRQLLYHFNDSAAEYPAGKTVRHLFEEQVEKTPHHVAVGGPVLSPGFQPGSLKNVQYLSYKELNDKSRRLAYRLRNKGVGRDTITAIMVEPSPEMIIGIFSIIKAGGAYLPIDLDSPPRQITHILLDSRTRFLLTRKEAANILQFNGETFNLDDHDIYRDEAGDLDNNSRPGDLLYVIYTSGTTGKSKGVLLKNENLVNYVSWFAGTAQLTVTDRTMLVSSFAFDLGYTLIYSSLLMGARLYLLPKEIYLYPEKLSDYILQQGITYVKMTPSLFSTIVNSPYLSSEALRQLRFIVLGGEEIQVTDVEKAHAVGNGIRVMNHYGPTEATIGTVARWIDFEQFAAYRETPTIGKPISNSRAYILNPNSCLLPIGVPGELCISGKGVAQGYLNHPELTAERFFNNRSYRSYRTYSLNFSRRLYRTGDLARWFPDGNIEFLGRIDKQVKIRGYRVELGEVEHTLSTMREIKNVYVMVKEDKVGARYLCAYVVPGEGEAAAGLKTARLRDYLVDKLPDCMIPAYFILLEEMPLTPNGKVDKKALPEPSVTAGEEYAAPETETQEKLAAVWAQVLNLDKEFISIDADFFELGGHSLRAVNLVTKIHAELNVKIRLGEIFIKPTIRQLAAVVESAVEETFAAVKAAEEKEYYPLSSAQKRMYILQQMDVNSIAYNVPRLFTLQGPLHREQLETSFKKLIDRHESLRTSFEIAGGEIIQRIHRTVDFQMEYYTVGGGDEAQRLVTDFIRPFDLSRAPLLRVGLILADEKQHSFILRVDMHHIISDGISAGLYFQDFLSVSTDREIPPLRLQYKDYAQWQNKDEQQQAIKKQETYWLKELAGELPVLNLPGDYPRPAVLSSEGDSYDFVIGKELTGALHDLAREEETTFYMVLVAIYNVMLAKITGQEDIIIGTVVAGRQHADLERVIGMFVNTVLLRNFPEKKKTFSQFLKSVKQRTLEAFDNQDCQFEDLVEKVVKNRDLSRNPLFDVLFELIDSASNPEIETPPQEQGGEEENPEPGVSISKFDLTLTVIDRKETLLASFEYRTKLFKIETIGRFAGYFKELASSVAKDAHIPIANIEIISDEEEQRLLAAAGENVGIEAAKEDSEKDIGDHMKADFDF